jgi:hypothetical protein
VPDVAASGEPTDAPDRWRLKTPEGQEYGPVTRAALDGWVAEGRVSGDCRLLQESDGVWHAADDVYAVLRPAPIGIATALWHNSPAQIADAPGPNPFPVGARGHVMNSDRGGVVLALGILSWAVGCPIFGILAWVMGSSDLQEMRRGTMDARGHGLTEAGRWIGMLHALLALILLVVGVFGLFVWGVFR